MRSTLLIAALPFVGWTAAAGRPHAEIDPLPTPVVADVVRGGGDIDDDGTPSFDKGHEDIDETHSATSYRVNPRGGRSCSTLVLQADES